jgi:hypothetical protein
MNYTTIASQSSTTVAEIINTRPSAASESSSSDAVTYSPILDVLLDREFTDYPLYTVTDADDFTTTHSTLLPSSEPEAPTSTTTYEATGATVADFLTTTETFTDSVSDLETKPNESGMSINEFGKLFMPLVALTFGIKL